MKTGLKDRIFIFLLGGPCRYMDLGLDYNFEDDLQILAEDYEVAFFTVERILWKMLKNSGCYKYNLTDHTGTAIC